MLDQQEKLMEWKVALLNYHMKHDNIVRYDAFTWNWNPGLICDDALLAALCINVSISDEIRWPTLSCNESFPPKFSNFLAV